MRSSGLIGLLFVFFFQHPCLADSSSESVSGQSFQEQYAQKRAEVLIEAQKVSTNYIRTRLSNFLSTQWEKIVSVESENDQMVDLEAIKALQSGHFPMSQTEKPFEFNILEASRNEKFVVTGTARKDSDTPLVCDYLNKSIHSKNGLKAIEYLVTLGVDFADYKCRIEGDRKVAVLTWALAIGDHHFHLEIGKKVIQNGSWSQDHVQEALTFSLREGEISSVVLMVAMGYTLDQLPSYANAAHMLALCSKDCGEKTQLLESSFDRDKLLELFNTPFKTFQLKLFPWGWAYESPWCKTLDGASVINMKITNFLIHWHHRYINESDIKFIEALVEAGVKPSSQDLAQMDALKKSCKTTECHRDVALVIEILQSQ